MAPKRRSRRRTGGVLKFPLLYSIVVSGDYKSTVSTINETFDRSRTWRIVGFSYEIRSDGSSFPFQFHLYSPISTTDTTWSSPLHIAGSVLRKGHYRNPCRLWYPSDVANTTPVFQLSIDCFSKTATYAGMCIITLHIEVGTREQSSSCPTLQPCPGSSDASSSHSSLSLV